VGTFTDQLAGFKAKVDRLGSTTTRLAVLELRSRFIVRSPVKTGRFRNNWFLGVDQQPDATTEEVDPLGDLAIARALGALPDPADGHVYYIVNNLPYAWSLEMGSSKQAPQGIVRLTLLEWDDIVADAANAAKEIEG
jgi:hypothetical protein